MKYKSAVILCFLSLIIIGTYLLPITCTAAEPVIIGVIHSEKFPQASMMKNSFEMALKLINDKGGIKERSLKLVYMDDKGDRHTGEQAVKDFVNLEKASMLVGGYSSTNTIYTARMAEKSDIPFLICTAADDRITQRKWKNIYRLNPPISEYTKGLEQLFLNNIKPKSMTIVYENSSFGTGGALRMMWFCRENNIDIHDIIPYYKEKTDKNYFNKVLKPVKENPPEVIYMISYLNDGALLVKTINELQINSLLCGGAGGFTHPEEFISMTGDSANHLITATLWTKELKYPETKTYYNEYVNKYSNSPDYHGAEAYSALLVAANALKKAASFKPKDIRASLDKTDYITAFGPVKFLKYDKFERQNHGAAMVLQIINGEYKCVWPQSLAASKFISPPDWRINENK